MQSLDPHSPLLVLQFKSESWGLRNHRQKQITFYCNWGRIVSGDEKESMARAEVEEGRGRGRQGQGQSRSGYSVVEWRMINISEMQSTQLQQQSSYNRNPLGISKIQHDPAFYPDVENPLLIRNNKIFAILLILLEAAFMFIYGFLVVPQTYTGITSNTHANIESTYVAILVLVGFGLYFSYLRNLSWSGLGFNLLIVAITFQYYFLVNGFWTKARIMTFLNPDGFSLNSTNIIKVYLSDDNLITFGATSVGALKCALSMGVAFASIQGKAGPLELLLLVLFGGLFYELNRQVVSVFSNDFGGSTTIFCFGGFMGGAINLVMYFLRQREHVVRHPHYGSSKFNVTWALIGSCFVWVFFPSLALDMPPTIFNFYLSGLSTTYGISAAVFTVVALDLLLKGKLNFRNVICAPISGGVFVLVSGFFVYSPLESIILGFFAGAFQVIFNSLDKHIGEHGFISHNTFFNFGLMGLLGGFASAVIRALDDNSQSPFVFGLLAQPYTLNSAGNQVLGALTCAGIGIVGGLFIGVILWSFNEETVNDYYHDRTYWAYGEDNLLSHDRPDTEMQYVKSNDNFASGIESGIDIKGRNAIL